MARRPADPRARPCGRVAETADIHPFDPPLQERARRRRSNLPNKGKASPPQPMPTLKDLRVFLIDAGDLAGRVRAAPLALPPTVRALPHRSHVY
jgi:hypothetical protein